MWEKIQKDDAQRGRGKRTQFAVRRERTRGKRAQIVVPAGATSASRVDVYEKGGRYLAFRFHDSGEFALWNASPKATAKAAMIPSRYSSRIPYGTTDVSMARDGDMFVLDLDAIPQQD